MKQYVCKFLWLLLIMTTFPLFSYGINITLGKLIGISYEICVVIGIAIFVPVIAEIKMKNQEKQSQYLEGKENTPSKIKMILKSKDLHSEIIVFLILMFPFISKIIIDQGCESVLEFIFLFLSSVISMGTIYGLLSFITLFIVYSGWKKKN